MQHQFLKARSARLVRGSASLAALALGISLAPSVAHAQRITQGGGNGAWITGRTIGQGGIAGGGGGASRGAGGSAAQTPDGTASAGGISSGGAAGGQPGTPNDIAAGGGGTGGSSAGATGGDGGAGNLVTATGNFAFSIDYVGGDGGIGAGSGASAGGGGAGLVLTGANVQVTTQGYDVTGGNGGRGSGQGSGGGGGAALVLLNGGSVTVGGGAGGAFSTITGGIGQEYGGSGAGIFLYDGGTLTIRNGNKVTGGEGGTFTTDGGTAGAAVLSNLGTVVNEGAIAGGEGGYGYSRGGRAGDGVQAWGGTIQNSATGTITGGRGGYNNSGNPSHYTGAGGAAVRLMDGQAATLINAGEINGGAGGPRYAFGTAVGAGGMGVVGAAGGGSTIINSGIIRGGVNASSQRNLAIGLFGDNNRLELRAGSYMDGGVVVQAGGTNNVLALGGSADSTFVVTEIGSTASFNYYLGFDTFEKSGTSTWTLTGTGDQDWRITGGNLIGDTNSLGGNLTFTAAPLTSVVAFNQNFDGSYAGTISGTGTMLKMGSGTVTLTGGSSVDWAINQGGVIADANNFTGNARILAGASLTFNQAGNASYAGTLVDAGDLHKTGAGRLTLTGDSSWLTGTTFVEEGTLTVNGRLGSSVTVASGATLGGSGTVGKTLVESGGHLAPGNSIGTLNVVGGLTVAAGANLDFELGQPGGLALFGISDRIVVSGGDLALDGTINLSQSGNPADGAAGIGYYRLITYTHQITSNTAVIGTTPGLSNVNYELQVGGGSVDLFISPSLIPGDDTLQHWQGGDGTWNAANTQWLNQGGTAPASWAGNYAVFKDDDGYVGGTITVAGAQSFLGLQFVDKGYVLQGSGQLVTDPAGSEIRVLADSAEIANEITGTGALIKTEAGTLILTGTNSYSGTTIQAGTLQIGNGGTTGSITNNVVNNGTLAFARSDATSFDGIISGTGAVRVLSGDVTLTGDSSYSGGTGIAAGATLRLGSGTSGSIGGNVANDGTLAFTRSDATSFGGTISGAGAVQVLSGSVTLTANNGYTGGTSVANGATLQLGRGSTTGAITGNVANNGTLAFGRSDEISFGGVISGTGAVRILSGGVALTADNGYTGGTSIANGAILQIGNGGTSGAIVGTVANDGTLAFARSDAGTLGGRITGSGAVQVLSGSLTLTAGNSYTGGTSIATGATLQLGNGGTTGSITGNVANSGTLAFARSSSNNFAGTISGSGAVRVLTGGVTFTADSGYTGGTSIAAGATLQLGDGGTTGGITGNVANAGTLAFNRSNNLVFAGVLSGAGSIRQAGSGKTELTGDSSGYTGTTSVAAGTLAVNGKLGGTLTVLAAGRLQGTGTVGNTIVSGTIAPGNSIGTLNVAGNIVFNIGSTYEVEADAAGLADRIVASGTATLNGGTVSVLAGAGNYRPETNYLILHADGGIAGTGRFGGVTSNLAFLDPSLSYDGNNVYLRLRRNDISFASIGATPNQIATGTATQGLGWNSPVFAAAVNLSAEQARGAFDQLSGEVHASARTALIEDSRFLREAVGDRLRAADSGFAIWGNGVGSWGHWGSDGNAARLNRSVNGFVLGADAPVLGNARLGLVGSYGRASFDTRAHGSSGTRDSYEIGVYGGADLGAAAVRIGVAHGWHRLDTTRLVAFPGFTDSLKGEQDARTTQAFGELAYTIGLGATRVEPFANFAHVRLSSDDATEKGGAAALRLASADSDTSFTTLGLRAAPSFALGSAKLSVRGALGWRHAFGDVTPLSAMQFASGGSSFGIAGTPIVRDAAALDAGIDVALTARAVLGIAYGGQFGSGASDQSVRASFSGGL